jgi:TolB-like protein/Tfp pilus assembly protein PilF
MIQLKSPPQGQQPDKDADMASPDKENPDPAKALISWKEIAVFLNRAERTVKRWERERGLPVHRVPGRERGGVFAYPSELTDWLKGKADELEAEDQASEEPDAGLATEQAVSGQATGQVATPVQTLPVPAPTGHRWTVSPARVAAWLLPLGLTAALIFYFSASHNGSRVTAVGDRESSVTGGSDLAPDSVAVLPFTNAAGNQGSDYLSDGITESLIGNLARIPQLKVRSRDSVFRLKGKDIDVKEAGSELGVSVVVSGRVAVEQDNIRVSAELTNVHDNTELWGKRYAGKISSLVQLQGQIAGDIAEQLRSSLSSADKQRVSEQGTQSPEAYTLYLKGRYWWNLRNFSNLRASIPFFNQAIAKDPNYALAYSALADVYSALPYFDANPAEDFPKSSIAAREALRLDPTLAHPHAILASVQTAYDWDFAGGEAEFRKALALDPNDATAHQWFAEYLGMIGGREQEALKEIDQAHLLDPTSPVIRRVKGSVLVAARRYDDAIAVCQQLLVDNPTYNLAHDCLFYAYWGKRMYPQVIEQWNIFARHSNDKNYTDFDDALERGYRSAGWRGALTEGAKAKISQRETGYASPYEIARLYADLGDKEKAFEWLNTAYREHDFVLRELNTAFEMDNLRSDPRYAELVRKVGLPKLK